MDVVWTSQSNPGKQVMLSVACTVVGLVLLIGYGDYVSHAGTNGLAGFLLGALLLTAGVAAYLASSRQTVVVDPKARRIIIDDLGRFGRKRRTIAFGDIAEVHIGYLGKASNLVEWYYLALKLRSGENYPLFAPGRFYEGASDRATLTGWQRRLEEYLRA